MTFHTLGLMRVMLSMFIVDLWGEKLVRGFAITAEIFTRRDKCYVISHQTCDCVNQSGWW